MAPQSDDHSYTYSQDADSYSSTDDERLAEPHIVDLVSSMADYLNPSAGTRILDIGCGTGRYEIALEPSGTELAGIDPDPQMLKIATDRFPNIQFDQAFANDIPHESGSFDAAFSIGVLAEHAPFDLDILQEISRVLKPGAPFFLTIRQRRSRGGQLAALANAITLGAIPQLNGRMERTHWITPTRAATQLNNAGFTVESVTDWHVPYMPWPHSIIKVRNGIHK
jgi:ubiquinone/menaquinone biosynthesis C-methylase UbiE